MKWIIRISFSKDSGPGMGQKWLWSCFWMISDEGEMRVVHGFLAYLTSHWVSILSIMINSRIEGRQHSVVLVRFPPLRVIPSGSGWTGNIPPSAHAIWSVSRFSILSFNIYMRLLGELIHPHGMRFILCLEAVRVWMERSTGVFLCLADCAIFGAGWSDTAPKANNLGFLLDSLKSR